ncbi:MAG: kinE 3 [Acidobacteria bacterium]|jgi:two-component system sensor histidine kinase PilS (NtrC family)|nr:kinE 3 [Acidobacteriota bacterium]
MSDAAVRRRVVQLMIWRLIITTILLGSAAAIQLNAAASAQPGPLYVLIAWTYALSTGYAAGLRLMDRAPWLLDVQLALDVLTAAAFIWVTGGILSPFSFVYVLPIMAASAVHGRRGALRSSALSMILYGATAAAQYARAPLQPWSVWEPGAVLLLPGGLVAQYNVAVHLLGFLAVGLLSGSLAERVRRADEQLADASTAIANLQAYSEHIINSLTMGLVTSDLQGRILTFNRAAEGITGHARGAAAGRPAAEVLGLPAAFAASLDAERPSAGSRRADYRYRRPDGTEIDLGLSATTLETSSGTSGFLFTFQDVTTIKRLERDARMQQRLAAVGEMAAGIAHEIRNPLASISGSMQILRKELALNGEQSQLMDIVLRESERLNGTIRSFLAYARPQRFGITRLDLRPVLQDVALLLRNSAEVGGDHVVDVDVPGVPVWCEVDEGQVRQVIWNLATNGLRAMPDGGRLRLGARRDAGDGGGILVVQDEGVGIPESEVDAIFQPFHGTFEKGSGLGMAIVHRIVNDYGGQVRVTSKPGTGTTVEVRLPAHAAAAA